jgi:hypothetical protein
VRAAAQLGGAARQRRRGRGRAATKQARQRGAASKRAGSSGARPADARCGPASALLDLVGRCRAAVSGSALCSSLCCALRFALRLQLRIQLLQGHRHCCLARRLLRSLAREA